MISLIYNIPDTPCMEYLSTFAPNLSPSFVGFYIPAPWFASGIYIDYYIIYIYINAAIDISHSIFPFYIPFISTIYPIEVLQSAAVTQASDVGMPKWWADWMDGPVFWDVTWQGIRDVEVVSPQLLWKMDDHGPFMTIYRWSTYQNEWSNHCLNQEVQNPETKHVTMTYGMSTQTECGLSFGYTHGPVWQLLPRGLSQSLISTDHVLKSLSIYIYVYQYIYIYIKFRIWIMFHVHTFRSAGWLCSPLFVSFCGSGRSLPRSLPKAAAKWGLQAATEK